MPINEAHLNAFRQVVIRNLKRLKEELSVFEQTCHSHTVPDIELSDIGKTLTDCWKSPTAYSISNLSQEINQFIRKHERVEESRNS